MPGRLSSEFLCGSYIGVSPSGSNSNVPWLFHPGRGEGSMLDFALSVGFAFFCLFIAYERLSNRL